MARQLCSFHPSGQSFAIVSHDQRLKVFSTLTQQLQQDLTEAQHLTHTITAIAYPQASSKAVAPIVALGTKSGEILLWNTKKGEVEHKLGVTTSPAEKHQAAITSLAFHASGSYLFSASVDKSVKQWAVANGAFVTRFQTTDDASSPSFHQLAASPDGNLLVAGGAGALLLWNVAAPASPIREYQGPTERISCVAFSPDSRFVASGNATDRYLSVWSAETDADQEEATQHKKKSKKKAASSAAARSTPVHTITLQTAPVSVQFNAFVGAAAAAAKATYQIGALADSSILSLTQWSPAAAAASAAATASTPQTCITIPAATTQSEAAKRRDAAYQAAGKNAKHKATAASSTLLAGEAGDAIGAGQIQSFQFESGSKVRVARGDAVRPQFETIEFRKSDDAFEAQIVLGKFQAQQLMNGGANSAAAVTGEKKRKAAAAAISNEAVTLGAQHMTDVVHAASSALDGEAPTKKAKTAGKSKSDALSRSLADRLAESESQQLRGAAFDLTTGDLPKAGSLQTILQQALHSNDTALVEYCLTAGAAQLASNATLIRATVRRLAPTYVLPLLNHLMGKFASRPNRSAALLPWLREIFKCHTAYLIRQPQLTHKLSPLYHLLDTRLSVFKKLLKLQGRLELLLSQISAAKNGPEDEEDAAAQGPINTFNDGEEAAEQAASGDEEDEDEDEDDQEEDEDMEGEEDEDAEDDAEDQEDEEDDDEEDEE